MSDLPTLLTDVMNPDQAVRSRAEDQLRQAADTQYVPFIQALVAELANESQSPVLRQMAGIYLKNLIHAEDGGIKTAKQEKWAALDPAFKDQIRAAMLQVLLSPVQLASHTAAQALAEYGAHDLPLGQWPLLMGTLFGFVSQPEVAVDTKIASLEALGYICDALEVDHLDKPIVDQILSTIVGGMGAHCPDLMKRAAITALSNSLDFTHANFEIAAERSALMEAVCNATVCADIATREKGFECLTAIAQEFYKFLPEYIQAIFPLTAKAIAEDEEEVAKMAIEFWVAIFEEEFDREETADGSPNFKFTQQVAPHLIPVILQALSKLDDSAEDEDSWTVSDAAALSLEASAPILKDTAVDLVLPYIHQNIQSPSWQIRYSSIVAFKSIIEGPEKEKLKPIIAGAMPILVAYLKDEKVLIRDISAQAIAKIFEVHLDLIDSAALPQIVAPVVEAIDDADVRVGKSACYVLDCLANGYQEDEGEDSGTNILSPYIPTLLQKLFVVAERPGSELKEDAYEAACDLIAASADDLQPVVLQVLQEALNRMFVVPQSGEARERSDHLSLICGIVNVCVRKLTKEAVMPMSDAIMVALLQVLSIEGSAAHEESFMAVGLLAEKLGEDFEKYLQAFIPFLYNGLKREEEKGCCATAIGAVGDLFRGLKVKMAPYCDDIVTHAMSILRSGAVDRNLKPQVISCFSDIAMAIESNFERYNNIVLTMIQQAGQTPLEAEADEDTVEFVTNLRTSILEAYTGIVMGFKDSGRSDVLFPYAEGILQFVQTVAQQGEKSDELLKSVVGLIGDMFDAFGPYMAPLVNQPWIVDVLQEAEAIDDDASIRQLAKYTRDVMAKVAGQKK